MRWAGYVARIGDMRNAYNILVGKPYEKRPFGRRKHRWEDNIRMVLREIGWEVMACMRLAQDAEVAGFCEHCNEPSGSIKGVVFLD
jgi:hypothetical protein